MEIGREGERKEREMHIRLYSIYLEGKRERGRGREGYKESGREGYS